MSNIKRTMAPGPTRADTHTVADILTAGTALHHSLPNELALPVLQSLSRLLSRLSATTHKDSKTLMELAFVFTTFLEVFPWLSLHCPITFPVILISYTRD